MNNLANIFRLLRQLSSRPTNIDDENSVILEAELKYSYKQLTSAEYELLVSFKNNLDKLLTIKE